MNSWKFGSRKSFLNYDSKPKSNEEKSHKPDGIYIRKKCIAKTKRSKNTINKEEGQMTTMENKFSKERRKMLITLMENGQDLGTGRSEKEIQIAFTRIYDAQFSSWWEM